MVARLTTKSIAVPQSCVRPAMCRYLSRRDLYQTPQLSQHPLDAIAEASNPQASSLDVKAEAYCMQASPPDAMA